MKNCPQCNNEMVKYSKKFYFIAMLITSLFIWPMVIFLPFMPFMPVLYKCRQCKKVYKEKDLMNHGA
jgi:uncharacterized protein with PIN domain